jgi:hypothetical protein
MKTATVGDEDWDLLASFFPRDWKKMARESGALKGLRQDKSQESCLRVLLLHLGCGFSLRETVLRARQSGLANLSDVALLKRLRKSKEWLWRLCCGLLSERSLGHELAGKRSLRLIDATIVKEPGPTGSQWRIHYSFQWPKLECDYFKVTPSEGKETGESLRHYPINPEDYILVDRGYCHASGLHYAASRQAYVTVRLNPQGIRLETRSGGLFVLLAKLKTIRRAGQISEWNVSVPLEGRAALAMRLCVIRKSQTAILRAERKLQRASSKHGTDLQPETLVYAQYVMVLSTFPPDEFPAEAILQGYRFRWQIEVLFKRLKQIAQLGHLPKHDEESAKAWLYGKLFVALLTDKLIQQAGALSPWGYDLENFRTPQPVA